MSTCSSKPQADEHGQSFHFSEIKNEGLVVDEEIVCLKEMEKDCEAIASLAAVPDWSVAGLDLPQVSEDSVANDEAAGSFSGKGASS